MARGEKIIIRESQEHRKELVNLIKQQANKYSTWQLWDDLVYMIAAALSQPLNYKQKREDEYLKRINKYDKSVQALFPQIFREIVLAFEREGFADILGDIYMQLELYNHWHGQYFTPFHICEFMAKIIIGDNSKEEIEKKGYISISDPCCGGGALLIGAAKVLNEQHINYQRDVLFVAQDIDYVVALMCYIQMSLLGMPGYVIIGDSLTVECREIWYTPMYYVSGLCYRRQKETEAVTIEKQEDTVNLRESESGQLELIF